mmetsp:Transcript_30171/g.55130  ORF Transcript_30171/g.55130 Transcript_30171/m.55130 type:complete len:365 (-) Transcript_30171:263-1357(-)
MPPLKRKREDGDDGGKEDKPERGKKTPATIGQLTSNIKNKLVRSELYAKLKHKQEKEKKRARKKRQKEYAQAIDQGLEPPPKLVTKTIENTREKDETMVTADDDEIEAEQAQDEFAEHFSSNKPPKVLITTCYKPSKIMYTFISEMLELLPCATYYKREGFPLKHVVAEARKHEFTDVLVFNEDRKIINGMIMMHLPKGPTAHFRISNLVLGKDIKGHGRATAHRPELVLNNFDTRLGQRLGRMIASLFPQQPEFRGRRVVTFHNQRDFIFVRHHRYIFEEKERREAPLVPETAEALKAKKKNGTKTGAAIKKKAVIARLQELGPKFTLKLESLRAGTFDSDGAEFEWLHKHKDMDTSRRRFHL